MGISKKSVLFSFIPDVYYYIAGLFDQIPHMYMRQLLFQCIDSIDDWFTFARNNQFFQVRYNLFIYPWDRE
jgi:hypothetical protein